MRVTSPDTHYELGKLRALHDRWIHHDYKRRGIAGAFMEDPELNYHLDALEALINMDADPDPAS